MLELYGGGRRWGSAGPSFSGINRPGFNPSNLPGLATGQGTADRVRDAIFRRGKANLDPIHAQQRADLSADFANRGIAPSSAAASRRWGDLQRGQSNAYENLLTQAEAGRGAEAQRLFSQSLTGRQQALREKLLERTQPLNEALAVLGKGQLMPQTGFPSYTPVGLNTQSYAGMRMPYDARYAGR